MTSHLGRRGLAVLMCSGVASAAFLVPATAYAESLTVADPSRDVVRITGGGGDDAAVSPAPRVKAVDLVSTRFNYGDQKLVVRGTARAAAADVSRVVRVKGGGQDLYFYASESGVEGEGGACEGATTSVDQDTSTYTVKIPASCFGRPGKVQVGLGLVRTENDGSTSVLDDARRKGFPENASNLRLTRGLKRG